MSYSGISSPGEFLYVILHKHGDCMSHCYCIHRLRVTRNGVFLHCIKPLQFVNSVEFDSDAQPHDTCQVSVQCLPRGRFKGAGAAAPCEKSGPPCGPPTARSKVNDPGILLKLLCSNSQQCVYVNDILSLLCLILHLYYLCHFRILLLVFLGCMFCVFFDEFDSMHQNQRLA